MLASPGDVGELELASKAAEDEEVPRAVGIAWELVEIPDFPETPEETADVDVVSVFCEIAEDPIVEGRDVPDAVGIGCEIVELPDSPGIPEEIDVDKRAPDELGPLGCRVCDTLIPVACDPDKVDTPWVADSVAVDVID